MSPERGWRFWKRRKRRETVSDPLAGQRARVTQMRHALEGKTDYGLDEALGWDPELEVKIDGPLDPRDRALVQGFVAELYAAALRKDRPGIMDALGMPVREASRRMQKNSDVFVANMMMLNPELREERKGKFAKLAKKYFRPLRGDKKKFVDLKKESKGKPPGLAKVDGKVVVTTRDQGLRALLSRGFAVFMNPQEVKARTRGRGGEEIEVKVKKRLPWETLDNYVILDEEGVRIFDPDRGRDGELYPWGRGADDLVFVVDADPRISDLVNKFWAIVGKRRQTAIFGVLKVVRKGDGAVLTEIPMFRPWDWAKAAERLRSEMSRLMKIQERYTQKMTESGEPPIFPNDFYKRIPPKVKQAVIEALRFGRRRGRVVAIDPSQRELGKEEVPLPSETLSDGRINPEFQVLLLKGVLAGLLEITEADFKNEKELRRVKRFVAEVVKLAHEIKRGKKFRLERGWEKKPLQELIVEAARIIDRL